MFLSNVKFGIYREMSKLVLNKGDGTSGVIARARSARSNLDCFVASLLAMTRKFPAFLTFAIYNAILLMEKEGIEPKRQTLSNQRAQSRASAKDLWREGRLLRLKILERELSQASLPEIFFEENKKCHAQKLIR